MCVCVCVSKRVSVCVLYCKAKLSSLPSRASRRHEHNESTKRDGPHIRWPPGALSTSSSGALSLLNSFVNRHVRYSARASELASKPALPVYLAAQLPPLRPHSDLWRALFRFSRSIVATPMALSYNGLVYIGAKEAKRIHRFPKAADDVNKVSSSIVLAKQVTRWTLEWMCHQSFRSCLLYVCVYIYI